LRAIASDRGADAVNYRGRDAIGIGRGLHQHRRDRADQHRLRRPAIAAVARDIARHFAAAGRMADMDRVLQAELRGDRGDIGGVGVHVVAGRAGARATVATPVMRDDAEALRREDHHLRVPIVAAQRPAVVEHDRLPLAPALVEDARAVVDRDRSHRLFSVSVQGCAANRSVARRGERHAGGHRAPDEKRAPRRHGKGQAVRVGFRECHGWSPPLDRAP